jgi:hypothetical protein
MTRWYWGIPLATGLSDVTLLIVRQLPMHQWKTRLKLDSLSAQVPRVLALPIRAFGVAVQDLRSGTAKRDRDR